MTFVITIITIILIMTIQIPDAMAITAPTSVLSTSFVRSVINGWLSSNLTNDQVVTYCVGVALVLQITLTNGRKTSSQVHHPALCGQGPNGKASDPT